MKKTVIAIVLVYNPRTKTTKSVWLRQSFSNSRTSHHAIFFLLEFHIHYSKWQWCSHWHSAREKQLRQTKTLSKNVQQVWKKRQIRTEIIRQMKVTQKVR